jgi:hypothetical protein
MPAAGEFAWFCLPGFVCWFLLAERLVAGCLRGWALFDLVACAVVVCLCFCGVGLSLN